MVSLSNEVIPTIGPRFWGSRNYIACGIEVRHCQEWFTDSLGERLETTGKLSFYLGEWYGRPLPPF